MTEEQKKRVALNIRCLREYYGESREELGSILFVERGTIFSYETGRTAPDHALLLAIAKHFSIPVDELLNSDFSHLTQSDSMRFAPDITKAFRKMITVIFPLVTSDKAMQNKNFRKGYEKCSQVIDTNLKGRRAFLSASDFGTLFYLYSQAMEDGVIEAAANYLWCLFTFWEALFDDSLLEEISTVLTSNDNDNNIAREFLKINEKTNNPSSATLQKRKKYLEKFDDRIYRLIKKLKSNADWYELGDYYLAMKHYYGMFEDDDMNLVIHQRMGIQLLFSLSYLDNKYADNFLSAVFEMFEIPDNLSS